MAGAALIILIVALAAVAFGVRTYYWPLGPCPRCSGRGRGRWSTAGAYNRSCPRCGGKGERIRPLALVWPKHREEARQRKEARERR